MILLLFFPTLMILMLLFIYFHTFSYFFIKNRIVTLKTNILFKKVKGGAKKPKKVTNYKNPMKTKKSIQNNKMH